MIKVASYCRVSTDNKDQLNSFEAQQRYFRDYIKAHPDWELYAVYADEGVSGTSTRKRTQFNRMIQDAHMSKFNLIITKEVSRFSRNLLDTIAYTRELKTLGIGVIFVNDGFSSMDPDAELRLSIMGSIAQEESRKTSSRVKWGQTRQMEQGVVFGPSLLGYDVHNGCLTINPDGAQIVKQIFYKYGVEKKGTSVIAKELQLAGIKTSMGNSNWSSSQIIKILRNEKYVGDLVQKKSITPDYLSHTKKYNRGEEELIKIQNHHTPIIDRALWNTVQQELQIRNKHNKLSSPHSNHYIFSGKIICGECGARFVARKKHQKSGTLVRWMCYTVVSKGSASDDSKEALIGCNVGKTIRDELVRDIVTKAIKQIPADFEWMTHNLIRLVTSAVRGTRVVAGTTSNIKRQIQQITTKKEALIEAYLSGVISSEEIQYMKDQYDRKLKTLHEQLRSIERSTDQENSNLEDIVHQIQLISAYHEISESCFKALLKHLIVRKDGIMEVQINHIPQIWYFKLHYHSSHTSDTPSNTRKAVSLQTESII